MQTEGKHKDLDQSSQERADPEASIQYSDAFLKSRVNHKRL